MSACWGQQLGRGSLWLVSRATCWLLPLEFITDKRDQLANTEFKTQGVYLKTHSLFGRTASRKQTLKWLLVVYINVCFICQPLIGFKWESSYQNWQVTLKSGIHANASDCVLSRDIELNEAYRSALAMKHLAGLGFMASFDVYTRYVLIMMASLELWVTIFMLVFSHFKPIRIASLSFMLHPETERAQLKSAVAKLARQLVDQPEMVEQVDQQWKRCKHSGSELEQDTELIAFKRRQTRRQLKLALSSPEILEQALPASLARDDNSCLPSLYRTVAIVCLVWLVIAVLPSIAYFANIIDNQIKVTMTERLSKFHCESLYPNGQLPKHRVQFDRGQFWSENRHKYHQADGNSLFWLELAGNLAKQPSFWLFILHLTLYIVTYYPWFTLHFIVYICNFQYQLLLLNDMEHQLDAIAAKFIEADREMEQQETKIDVIELEGLRTDRLRAVHSAFAASYLSFGVFRAQFGQSKWISNCIACCTVIIYVSIPGISYLAFGSSESTVLTQVLLHTWIFCLVIVNAICASSSLIVHRIKRLSNKLLHCLAKSSRHSLELSCVIGFWRRQLFTESDLKDCYSLSLFGFQLSLENLIKLNSNLFGLALYIYRKYYSQSS